MPLRSPFHSFFMGGFESATHRRKDLRRIDVAYTTQHDLQCERDYAMLQDCGIATVRDGLRWHLIEREDGSFDWSSFLPMLHAAHRTGTQVIWDLCHWGVPEGVDPFAASFPARFARFAREAARLVRREAESAGVVGPRLYCPINEISYWSWTGGDTQHLYPYGLDRGAELKRQLVRASLEAIHAIRSEDPEARFMQAEPVIHISGDPKQPEDSLIAAIHTGSQYEAWDMLAGLATPELGGSVDSLDIIGVNYYWNNQWVHEGERTPPGHSQHRPLHVLLQEIWQRYRRPLFLSETGAEAAAGVGWLGYVSAEVRQAIQLGVPVLAVCLYPVMDYAGWDDDRHCSCGLIEASLDWSIRTLRSDLRNELRAQQFLMSSQTANTHQSDGDSARLAYSS